MIDLEGSLTVALSQPFGRRVENTSALCASVTFDPSFNFPLPVTAAVHLKLPILSGGLLQGRHFSAFYPQRHTSANPRMAAAVLQPSSSSSFAPPTSVSPGPDKYRGAVVEVSQCLLLCSVGLKLLQDLQLAPAFTLPRDEAIIAAIELAYDRDFSQIP